MYSHLHTDHIAGARVLRKAFGSDTPIIAHKRTRRYFSIRKVPFIDMPTEVVGDEGKTYQFGDTEIQLQYLGMYTPPPSWCRCCLRSVWPIPWIISTVMWWAGPTCRVSIWMC
ncbi:MBL fold metallo-hydrolase [Aliamphritea spongicola]